MKVLFAASEIYPFVKTGGLGDVAGALPLALKKQGADVRLLLPGYPDILQKITKKQQICKLPDYFGASDAEIIFGQLEGHLEAYVLVSSHFYNRKGIYGYEAGKDWPDNHGRFGGFCYAAKEIVARDLKWRPDIVHGNDWQCGLMPVYLKEMLEKNTPATVMTIHNMAYQGLFPKTFLSALKLSPALFNPDGIEFYNQIGFLKAGLQYADALTTVSPTYAKEIQEVEMGCGLDGLLKHREQDLTGILNGIDPEIWNPITDPHLSSPYDWDRLDQKVKNRDALCVEMGLNIKPKKPIFSVISRLVEQKGLDLLPAAIRAVLERGAGLVVLGSGDAELEEKFRILEREWPGQVAVRMVYDEAMAHRILGGADAVIIPSRFEPCGLVQMYGLRYGTLPIVRRTGGLADSVISDQKHADGFIFEEADSLNLALALLQAFEMYRKPSQWKKMQKRGMEKDFSWDIAARKYVSLYQKLLSH